MHLPAKPPSKERLDGFIIGGLASNEWFGDCAQDPSQAQRSERNGLELAVDDDITRRLRTGFDEICQQSELFENAKRMFRRQQGTGAPFHKMSLDLFGSNDAARPIAAFQNEHVESEFLQAVGARESGNSRADDNDIGSWLHFSAPSTISARARINVGSLLSAGTRRKVVIPASAADFL